MLIFIQRNEFENVVCSIAAIMFQPQFVNSSPHRCVSESDQHCFRQWLAACSAPSHYLNQCWLLVNWTLRDKLQGNSDQNTKLFIHRNAFENIVCELVAILSWGDEFIPMFAYLRLSCWALQYSVVPLMPWYSLDWEPRTHQGQTAAIHLFPGRWC